MATPQRRRGRLAHVVPLEAPLELLFERGLDAGDNEGWIVDTSMDKPPPPGCEELTFSWREAVVGGGRQHRTQCVHSHGLSDLFFPEVLYHRQIGVLYDGYHGVEECGIERLITPGDAEVWERSPVATGLAALMTTLSGHTGDISRLMWGRGTDHGRASSERMRYRMTVRRDFPTQGECTMVLMPRHPQTGKLLLEWGDASAMVFHSRPHSDPSKNIFTLFEQLSPMPWAPHLVTNRLFRAHRIAGYEALQMMSQCADNDIVKHISSDASYVIVGLRKCCRGGPLLPSATGDGPISSDEWEQFDFKTQHIAIYLNEFLRRLGFLEPMFYDSLHGKRLVHFQAVLQRGAWERVKVSFEERFQEQRSAFRRLLGGRVAPEIRIDAEPRFLTPPRIDVGCSASDPVSDSSISPSDPGAESAPVRLTFVHFCDRPHGTARSRADSL